MIQDYCPHCRRRTPHIKDNMRKLCKRCGRITNSFQGITFRRLPI